MTWVPMDQFLFEVLGKPLMACHPYLHASKFAWIGTRCCTSSFSFGLRGAPGPTGLVNVLVLSAGISRGPDQGFRRSGSQHPSWWRTSAWTELAKVEPVTELSLDLGPLGHLRRKPNTLAVQGVGWAPAYSGSGFGPVRPSVVQCRFPRPVCTVGSMDSRAR